MFALELYAKLQDLVLCELNLLNLRKPNEMKITQMIHPFDFSVLGTHLLYSILCGMFADS